MIQITELYPAPPSGSYEWVELYNASESALVLSNYKVVDQANHALKLPFITLPSGGYVLATASGVLNNSGDTVQIMSLDDAVLDSTTYSLTLMSSQSLSLCGDEWTITDITTPRLANTSCPIKLTPTIVPTIFNSPIPSIKSAEKIYLSPAPISTQAPTPQSFLQKHPPHYISQQPSPTIAEIQKEHSMQVGPANSALIASMVFFSISIMCLCCGIYLMLHKKIDIMKNHENDSTSS